MSAPADRFFQLLWYERRWRWLSAALLPLTALFQLLVGLRRAAYRSGLLRSHVLERPVVVIGNLSVGGTGKTPFTIWLARLLQARGTPVGIVLRGYGGRAAHWPRRVSGQSDWREVGDEAVLLARRTGAIVVAGPDRVAAARLAVELGARIVLSDDGLQHYRLARDVEIVLLDAHRGLGNERLLPAGPLREPRWRLSQAELIVLTQRLAHLPQSIPRNSCKPPFAAAAPGPGRSGRQVPGAARQQAVPLVHACARLVDAECIITGERRMLTAFRGTPVHALAGIGNPQAFFAALRACRLQVLAHALADHASITAADLDFADDYPVLMTEKDAVKCAAIADRRHWAVRMHTDLPEEDAVVVVSLLEHLMG